MLWRDHARSGCVEVTEPKVYVAEFGDSAVVYEIKYWLSDPRTLEITDALRTSIWYHLNRRQMRIPFSDWRA